MPDLDFKVTGVEPAARGVAPLLHFKVEVTNTPQNEPIHSVMLSAQIQIQAPQRSYSPEEKEKLFELFGTPDQWGQTLRTKLWAIANTNVRGFSGRTEATLSIPCTFDLNVTATKYFHSLEGGEVPLLFLFSGTIFYEGEDDRLQVQQISWNKECVYKMPVSVWQEMMDFHYPNHAWITLDRGMFDRLWEFKRREGLTSWDQVIEKLFAQKNGET